ncbi:SusC/RagA family TonB-linked outer membrane protein [Desertivirga xinjiangensis]|uniref:SusC/RagA family TonB-linked outer membrane protein n=1 Tax=Desertivirga xinjiangensis TaxID=539206 RepID=UPI00210CCA88|nr:TonB-dependent receptor [Pedobacter xinjiangensis]
MINFVSLLRNEPGHSLRVDVVKDGGVERLSKVPLRLPQRILLVCVLIIFLASVAFSQNAGNHVAGKVTDTSGEPLPGVSVKIKNSNISTTTDGNGMYKIAVPDAKTILVYTYLGFTTQQKEVGTNRTINIQLQESSNKLDEVVVIGYGSVSRRDLQGSVASIKGEDLVKTNVTSVNEALQGRLAGVQVNKGDGAPGSGVSILIRGANSFTGSDPLYVVDDVPVLSASTPKGGEDNFQTTNPLSFLNPQDIESIDVLKDASATAIYGSRGSNGVVLITTKKGKQGRDRVEFTSDISLSRISKKVDMLNASQFASFQNEAFYNSHIYEGTQLNVPYPGEEAFSSVANRRVYFPGPADYASGLKNTLYPDGFTGTDWLNEILHTGSLQNYTLRFSGGDAKGSYSISGNLTDQQGIIKKTGFDRYGLQLNLYRNISRFWQIGTNTNFTFNKFTLGKTNTAGTQPSLISSTLFYPSTQPANYNINVIGEDILKNLNLFTPTSAIDGSTDITNTLRIFSSSFVQANLSSKLNFRQRLGYNYNTSKRSTYYDRNTGEGWSTNGRASVNENYYSQIVSESILTYKNTLNKKHSINAVADFSYEINTEGNAGLSATNFPNDITKYDNIGAGLQQNRPQSYKGESRLLSYLGRVIYTYGGKYSTTVNFRADGSSKFAKGNKFGYFPGVAVAWTASKEPFIANLNVFSNLKVRGSAGATGNQGIGPYGTQYQMSAYNVPLNGALQSGYAINTDLGLVDPNLKWETTVQYDAGLDIGFFGDRLNFTFDAYQKTTSDLLQAVKIATSTGFSTMLTNTGTVENRGLEFAVNGRISQTPNFKWNVNANLSFNRNKITALPAGDQFAQRLWYQLDDIFIQRVGEPIGAIYGYLEDGYYDNLAEVKADPQFRNSTDDFLLSRIGEVKYKNFDNESSSISVTDRQIIGNTNPDFTYGITNDFSYRKFSLSIFFQGVQGGDILNANLLKIGMGQTYNIPQFAYDSRWTPESAARARWPKPLTAATRTMRFSDRYLEDASYLRLKSVNFGYTFKPRHKFIESLYLFGSATNLLTFSKYSWFDPDVNSFGGDASRRGVDMNSYPNTRMYTFGIKATL